MEGLKPLPTKPLTEETCAEFKEILNQNIDFIKDKLSSKTLCDLSKEFWTKYLEHEYNVLESVKDYENHLIEEMICIQNVTGV